MKNWRNIVIVLLLIASPVWAAKSQGGASSSGGSGPTTNPVSTAQGGTGAALAPTVGDLPFASSTTAFSLLSDVPVGQVLISGGTGTAPSYSANPLINALNFAGGASTTSGDIAGTSPLAFSSAPDGTLAGQVVFGKASTNTGGIAFRTAAGSGVCLIRNNGGGGNGSMIQSCATTISGALTIVSDNPVNTMARIPMAFSVNQQTALVANEHMGTFKTTKAITIENIVLDPENITCAVSATITCFDCGTSAGACTSAQTSTIYTSGSIATGSGGTSVDGTVTTAAVAAAHYITCEVTAGTCATFQANVSLMARPQ